MELTKDLRKRLDGAKAEVESMGLDAMLVADARNIQYLTGKDTGRLLVGREESVLWVKKLYLDLYSETYSKLDMEVREYGKDAVKDLINSSAIKRLGVENMGVIGYNKLSEELKCELAPGAAIEKLRSKKTGYEIEQIEKACEIAKRGMGKAYDVVRAGVPELYAVAEIEAEIRRQGSESPPFEGGMLLASGKNSADVHAYAGMEPIKEGSVVVVDLGARYRGYHSDVTRTIEVGRCGKPEKDLLEFVSNLRDEAIDLVDVGVKASEIHEFVEKKMNSKGYEFYHSTGHGVGLQIHERPNIGPGSEDVLEKNMAFTIEPGVYLAGRYGARFEDTVLLGKKKRILTR